MKKLVVIALVSAFTFLNSAYAAPDCEAKAISKDGKPLSGAAKASFIKKCEREAACEAKALSKDGKPLYGAAKTSSIKKCLSEAK
ncbi:MAG: hypothetical protein HS110_15520 [Zoogloeaceae bacterium]|nr:hypothetical protein [Zoogloeaceae bacterium]